MLVFDEVIARAYGSVSYTHLKIEHLTHTYQSEQGKNIALNDLSLEINEGEHLAVLGQNGCGKSTLAKHLNALLLPDKGTVTIDGMDSTDENSLWQIRQKVGMVFQNPDNQLVATTVEEDCAFGPENLGLEPAIIRERVDEALGKQTHLQEGEGIWHNHSIESHFTEFSRS